MMLSGAARRRSRGASTPPTTPSSLVPTRGRPSSDDGSDGGGAQETDCELHSRDLVAKPALTATLFDLAGGDLPHVTRASSRLAKVNPPGDLVRKSEGQRRLLHELHPSP